MLTGALGGCCWEDRLQGQQWEPGTREESCDGPGGIVGAGAGLGQGEVGGFGVF